MSFRGEPNGNIYTVLIGQHPIGMARADKPQDAIEFIQRLCGEPMEAGELRLRHPTANESEVFERRCGPATKDGVFGFCF